MEKDFDAVKDNPASVEELRDALEAAVKRQLMSDVPYGVLLSGGLDSSVISAITQTYAKHRIENDGETVHGGRNFTHLLWGFSFRISRFSGCAKVADAIGTIHHPIIYTFRG
ncbi:asparagine synthase-related protein [Paucibacter sp. O1-1]|nr:asparagine synthase-related protein [Paucibacter sp. O1-1]MDA3830951.1 asparagine synthase-related protein [Paucibacter sp. O1-1]